MVSSTAGLTRAGELPGSGERLLILHYHLFKNAGTSVDRGLRKSFGEAWGTVEARPGGGALTSAELKAWIDARPQLQAVSSHTAEIDPWSLSGLRVLPVVFLRHPIDRMRSAYDFERQQKVDNLGTRQARRLDFKGYAAYFLDHPHSFSFRNFQARRLAAGVRRKGLSQLDRALDMMLSLPFVGVVEQFETSAALIEALGERYGQPLQILRIQANSGARVGDLDARLRAIREELGDALYERAERENQEDFLLWKLAQARIRRAQSRAAPERGDAQASSPEVVSE